MNPIRAAWALTLAGVCAATICASATEPALAATWTGRLLPGEAAEAYMYGISCPTKDLCVAAGDDSVIASSRSPGGGTAEWRYAHAPEGTDDDHRPGVGHLGPNRTQIMGISCPSPELCVAASFDGDIYTSTSPTGGDGAWERTDIDGTGRDTHLLEISCPSPSLCVAVSGDRYTSGKVLTSTNPTGGASAWSVAQLPDSPDLRGVSCGSSSFCVAVAKNGLLLTSTDPTGGASAWRAVGTPGGPGTLQGVSCASTLLCAAGNAGGNLLISTSPLGGPSAWSEVDGGGSVLITGISCPSPSACVAVDNNGSVLTSTDPTGGPAAWSLVNVIPYVVRDPKESVPSNPNGMFGVSCPSVSFCAIAASGGRVFTSADPFAIPARAAAGTKGRRKRPRRPKTTIAHVDQAHRTTRTGWKAVRFRFYANGRVRGFLCKLDRRPFKPCRSPKKYRVRVGKHAFRVRAIGMTGLRGPIAVERFEIRAARLGAKPVR